MQIQSLFLDYQYVPGHGRSTEQILLVASDTIAQAMDSGSA